MEIALHIDYRFKGITGSVQLDRSERQLLDFNQPMQAGAMSEKSGAARRPENSGFRHGD